MGLVSFVSSSKPLQGALNLGADLAFDYANKWVNYRKQGGQLVFVSPSAYDNMYVYALKRTALQAAFASLNNLYAEYKHKMNMNLMKKAFEENQQKHIQAIVDKNNDKQNTDFNKQGVKLYYMGEPAPEGLVMWIGKQTGGQTKRVPVNTYYDKIRNLSFSSSQLGKLSTMVEVPQDAENVFIDFGPLVKVQSSNNVVMTKVQGRDFSRKELISGGDLVFTVTGKIVSNYPDVYPYAAVSSFISLMQHTGTIKVSNLLFQQFNVDRIVIRDFNLAPQQGFKNTQLYSFTCVAVEPDEEVRAMVDTIVADNVYIGYQAKTGWSEKLLQKIMDKTAEETVKLVTNLSSQYI